MSRISNLFDRLKAEGRKALIPFVTAGDPDLATTLALMSSMAKNGADIIELGIPFSDPMADGPVIQRASERALKHNVGLLDVLELVRQYRLQDQITPIVLMGYVNPLLAMGYAAFAQAAEAAGVDGMLTVDSPPEESEELVAALTQYHLDPIFLIAPTTPEARIEALARYARGYVYYVSLRGVTGAGNLNVQEISDRMQVLQRYISLPIGVGFGIRDGETARRVADVADAVVIGSRIVQEIESSSPENVADNVGQLIRSIRVALDA